MKKIQIYLFEVEEKWQKEIFTKILPPGKFKLSFSSQTLTLDNAGKFRQAEVVSIFIHTHIGKEILDKLPNLKFIATNSTGYDHIDIAEAKKRGIVVANVPFYGENTVAEHTFALILAISRKIAQSIERTRRGNFNLASLRGFDLKDKVIGVIGTGHIGQHVIRVAHGFEMRMLAFDPFPNKALESHYPLRYVSLDKLLAGSDVITLHAPYSQQTHHLINSKNIKHIKPGAILINTARGALVETAALFSALNSKRLAGAGLDVLEEEGLISEDSGLVAGHIEREKLTTLLADHRLLSMDNVLVTPHNAFNSQEAVLRIVNTTAENIKAWNLGKIINRVN